MKAGFQDRGDSGKGCEWDNPKPPDEAFQVTRVLYNRTHLAIVQYLSVGLCLSLDKPSLTDTRKQPCHLGILHLFP